MTASLLPDEVLFWTDSSIAPREWGLRTQRLEGGEYSIQNQVTWQPPGAQNGTWWTSNFRTAERSSPSHAALLVRRSDGISADEIAYLELIASDVEHLIGARRDRLMKEALDRASATVVSERRSDQRPGTIAAIATETLRTGLRAEIGVYFTFDGSRWCAEYVATRASGDKAAYAARPSVQVGDRALVDSLLRGRPFYWSDMAFLWRELARGGFPKGFPADGATASRAVIAPVQHEGDPIGFFCFGYLTGQAQLPGQEMVAHLGAVGNGWSDKLVYLAQRRFKHVYIDPIYSSRDTRIEVGKCAALMPFSEDWSDRIWSRVVRPHLVALGFSPVRADDLYGRDIMEDIWRMILSAEVVLADITGRNANVFYELGLAHALGKEVILLTQATRDIPFDLNRYRHIIYKDNLDGYDSLTKGLTGALTEVISRRGGSSGA
ncbi:hypothetical protein Q9R32_02755 [Actinotalea sp. AC32]|nr:hypothetical protein [Actinotalea sp. AC32]